MGCLCGTLSARQEEAGAANIAEMVSTSIIIIILCVILHNYSELILKALGHDISNNCCYFLVH